MLASSQIELLKRALGLMSDNENVTRCSEDTYLCTVEGDELLTQPLEYLCYHTGDLLYNMTKNFTKVLAFCYDIQWRIQGGTIFGKIMAKIIGWVLLGVGAPPPGKP